MNIRQNLHTHTTFCDGKHTPEEMVLGAIRCGCTSLGFSGHSCLPFDDSWTMKRDALPAYRAEVLRLRKQYAGQLELFLGLEQDYCSEEQPGRWDYRIGSVHCVEKNGEFLSVDHSPEVFCRDAARHYGGDFLSYAEDYYRLVGGVAERTACQIVGHFDLITKFNEGGRFFDESSPRYRAAALGALDRLSAEDVIFEINTGAISRGYRTTPYPAPFLLKELRKRGGRICLTSDCHSADTILSGLDSAARLAAACGFRETMVLTAQGFQPRPL